MNPETRLKQIGINMFINVFGKMLFPRLSPSQRRHELKNILIAIAVGALMAGVIVAMISMVGLQRR